MEECSCAARHERGNEELLESFAAVRSHCPALRHLVVPDDLWPDFQQWHRQADTVAYHRSTLLLAMERGYLGRVTSAAHRYLIRGGLLKPNVRQQYLQDLQERWMFYESPERRNQKFREFAGRVAELHVAEWLELQGWTISGLEALRVGPDIEAFAPDGQATAFEVKYIGTENDDFAQIMKSLAGYAAGGPVSPYDAANYLLFRVYEAAKQLQRIAHDRIAIVVVEDMSWWRFDLQLIDGWIDWMHPSFFPEHAWEGFLAQQRTRYPALLDDFQPVLRSLNAVWIFRQSGEYQYHREFGKALN